MSEVVVPQAAATAPIVQSPPAVPQPARTSDGDEARGRLNQLAERLGRGRDRLLMTEYLRLRRALM